MGLTFEEGDEESTAFSSTPVSGAVVLPLCDASTDNRIKGTKQQTPPAPSPPSATPVSAKCFSFSLESCFHPVLLEERSTLIVEAAAQDQLSL